MFYCWNITASPKRRNLYQRPLNTSRPLKYIVSRDFCNYRWTNRSQSGVAIVIVQVIFMFSYSYVIFMYFGESIYDISKYSLVYWALKME